MKNLITLLLLTLFSFSFAQRGVEDILKRQLEVNYEYELTIAQIYQTQIDELKKEVKSLKQELAEVKKNQGAIKAVNVLQGEAIKEYMQFKDFKLKQDRIRDNVNGKSIMDLYQEALTDLKTRYDADLRELEARYELRFKEMENKYNRLKSAFEEYKKKHP